MLQAFISTVREGVEAALIVGITLAYLAKIGRNDLRKSVYAALGAAFAGSIAVAVVLSRLNWNQDIFEGWVMLVAAVFVVTMIVFMMKTGRKLKGEIESKIGLFRRDAELERVDELHRHRPRRGHRRPVRSDVRQGQRQDQSAEILPGHHRDS